MTIQTTRWTLFSLAVLLAAAGGLQGGVWTADTEPEIAPSDPLWNFTGDLYDREYVAGDYLRINSMAEGALDRCYFEIVDGTSMDWSTLNALTARVRVGDVAEEKMGAASINVYGPNGDGTCDLYSIRFDVDGLWVRNVDSWEHVDADTSTWHDYTLRVDPDANGGAGYFHVYQDGTYLAQAAAKPNVGLDWNGVRWGDSSDNDAAGISDWNSIKWGADTTIPDVPEPALTLADGDINGDNFVGSADLDVIRSHWGSTVGGTVEYIGTWDGDALPQDSSPAWVPRGDAANSTIVSEGPDTPYMNLNTPATLGDKNDPGAYCDFALINTTDIDLTQSAIVDFKMRVNGQSDPPDNNSQVNAIGLYRPDGEGGTEYFVLWMTPDSFAGIEVDTSEWHDYRVVLASDATEATVYIDNFLTPAGTVSGNSSDSFLYNGIRFGDLSDSRAGDTDWAFVGWTDDPGNYDIQGDVNGDGAVNSGDLDVVRANWGREGGPAVSAVPEPGMLCLVLVGAVVFLMRRK